MTKQTSKCKRGPKRRKWYSNEHCSPGVSEGNCWADGWCWGPGSKRSSCNRSCFRGWTETEGRVSYTPLVALENALTSNSHIVWIWVDVTPLQWDWLEALFGGVLVGNNDATYLIFFFFSFKLSTNVTYETSRSKICQSQKCSNATIKMNK